MTRTHRAYAERAAVRATGMPTGPGPAASVVRLSIPGAKRAGEGGRWGLVLGGGGVLGAAWLVGALEALERARGIDARDAELILGTSAGSVVGALLAAGVSVAEQRAEQLHERAAGVSSRLAGAADLDLDRPAGPSTPPRPHLRLGSPALLRNNRGALRELPRTTVLAALAPAGRQKMTGVGRLIETVVPAGEWPSHPGFRAVALDYETGRRTVFGDPAAPAAGLSEAVLASCAIPGWFEPVTIAGRRYVDGGMWSATNVDLLADAGLDEIFVLAPMASAAYDAPGDWRTRLERRVRIASTRRCLTEARMVHLRGTAVTVLGPGPEDLELMGYNLMAPERRRVVLESAVRTGLTAFADPPVTLHLDRPAAGQGTTPSSFDADVITDTVTGTDRA
jgi:NTE family protein